MAIKLLISDLDGTLLGADSRITHQTADALNRAHRAGIRLLVATGRAWGTAAPLLRQAGVECDFVLLNGAEYRTAQGILQCVLSLSPSNARDAVTILQQHRLDFEINTDRGDFSTALHGKSSGCSKMREKAISYQDNKKSGDCVYCCRHLRVLTFIRSITDR